ncbi:hypothetical protein GINT2_001998 [Glugoides intestinalis]
MATISYIAQGEQSTDISFLKSLNIEEAIQEAFYLIWNTPNFKRQCALIDTIFSETTTEFHFLLLNHVIVNFNNIATDRRDKFFYLIKKALFLAPIDYLLAIKSSAVMVYILKFINDENKKYIDGWNDRQFVEYIAKCKSFLLECIDLTSLTIDKGVIQEFIERSINQKNREALYKLLKSQQSNQFPRK